MGCWSCPGHRCSCPGKGLLKDGLRALVGADFLLFWLNEYLARTAVFVQPLRTAVPAGHTLGGLQGWQLETAYVPLPLRNTTQAEDDADDVL
eukprot:scaffold346322_cov17-Prasinocladus_malaysianus.AAC.1